MTTYKRHLKKQSLSKQLTRLQARETELQSDADRLDRLIKKVKREKDMLAFQLREMLNSEA